MRIRFILDPEKATTEKLVGRNGHETHFIGDTMVYMTNGHPVLSVDDRWMDPSADLRDHVIRVEVDTVLARIGLRRRSGFYRLGTAEGVVEFIPAGNDSSDRSLVNVSAPTKDAALALWDAILEGSIAPELDYSAPQVSIPTFNVDRLARMEALAADIATILLEQAMQRLQDRIQIA